MAAKKDPCWTGYEAVPGKARGTEGSCRKKAPSKSTPGEKQFQAKRKKQLDAWEKQHPGAPRSAAQHLSAPKKKTASKKAASKKKTASGRS